ncbi:MAG: accessory factor UbiK family protein [Alphaproteobacteria bacterium]|nr:accessory factor UbiK family protein [Alphaproteobacteria bacterium]
MGVFNMMKMASGGASLANLVKREVEELLRDRLGALLQEQNQFVNRDEFEAVKIMAENALQENEKLRIKIADLEKKKAK